MSTAAEFERRVEIQSGNRKGVEDGSGSIYIYPPPDQAEREKIGQAMLNGLTNETMCEATSTTEAHSVWYYSRIQPEALKSEGRKVAKCLSVPDVIVREREQEKAPVQSPLRFIRLPKILLGISR